MSLLSLEGVQMTDHGNELQCLKTDEVHLAVCYFISLQFQLETVVLGLFLKAIFGWAANSRKRASDRALHSRILPFTSKAEAKRGGPELKNTVVCHSSALHQNEG